MLGQPIRQKSKAFLVILDDLMLKFSIREAKRTIELGLGNINS